MTGHYSYLVEKRDTILSHARMSPEAKNRALGLATRLPIPDPAAEAHAAQAEVARLTGANEELRATIRRLEAQQTELYSEIRELDEKIRLKKQETRADRIASRRRLYEQMRLAKAETSQVNIATIQAAFCEAYSAISGNPYTQVDLVSPRRSRAMAWPRMVCMVLVKTTCPVSLPTIAKAFGNRDHTTVMNALKKAPDILMADHHLAEAHDRVIARFTVRQT